MNYICTMPSNIQADLNVVSDFTLRRNPGDKYYRLHLTDEKTETWVLDLFVRVTELIGGRAVFPSPD